MNCALRSFLARSPPKSVGLRSAWRELARFPGPGRNPGAADAGGVSWLSLLVQFLDELVVKVNGMEQFLPLGVDYIVNSKMWSSPNVETETPGINPFDIRDRSVTKEDIWESISPFTT